MFYIPYFVDSALMECRLVWERLTDSCALTLSGVIDLIASGADNNCWSFQAIDTTTGFINNEYPDEILARFGGWCVWSEGVVIQWDKNIHNLKKGKGYTVGYEANAKFALVPVTAELFDTFVVGKPMNFALKQVEDVIYFDKGDA